MVAESRNNESVSDDYKSKISVIIPVYNVEKYIEKCLSSILSQTYKNTEILCILDGPEDNSSSIVKSFAHDDKRIKIFEQCHKGAAAARNIGLDNASGEFIFFLDSDDWVNPNSLEILYTAIQAHRTPIVSGNISVYNEIEDTYHPYKNRRMTGKIHLTYANFKKLEVVIWNKLYRISAFKGVRFVPGLKAEDEDFYWQIFSRNREVYAIPDTVTVYRKRNSTLSTKKNDETLQDHMIVILDRAYEVAKTHPDLKSQFEKFAIKMCKHLSSRNCPSSRYLKHLKSHYNLSDGYLRYRLLTIRIFLEEVFRKFKSPHQDPSKSEYK